MSKNTVHAGFRRKRDAEAFLLRLPVEARGILRRMP